MKQRLHVSNFANMAGEAVVFYNVNDVDFIAKARGDVFCELFSVIFWYNV